MDLAAARANKREREEIDSPLEVASAAMDVDVPPPVIEIPDYEREAMEVIAAAKAREASLAAEAVPGSVPPEMKKRDGEPMKPDASREDSEKTDSLEKAQADDWQDEMTKEEREQLEYAKGVGPEEQKFVEERIQARVMADRKLRAGNQGDGKRPALNDHRPDKIPMDEPENRGKPGHGNGQVGVADVIAAPAVAAIKVAELGFRAAKALTKGTLSGIKTVTPIAVERFQRRAFERRSEEFDRTLKGLKNEGPALGKHVEAFNLAFLGSAKTDAIRSYAASKGIPFNEVLTDIRNGTAEPAVLAMARDALSDPSVVEASHKIDQSLESVRLKSERLAKLASSISSSAMAEHFDFEEKSKESDEIQKAIMDGLPDQAVKDPEDEDLKERLKESMKAFIQMIQAFVDRITSAFRR